MGSGESGIASYMYMYFVYYPNSGSDEILAPRWKCWYRFGALILDASCWNLGHSHPMTLFQNLIEISEKCYSFYI